MGELQHIRGIRRKAACAQGLFKTALISAFFTLLLPSEVYAQTGFRQVHSSTLEEPVIAASVDRPGELYTLTSAGKLTRIGIDGTEAASTKLASVPDLMEPRDGSHIFLFWASERKYQLMLPDLQTVTTTRMIDSAFAVSPFLACPSGDHDVIVLDSADWSLKKINTRTQTVLFETILFTGEDKHNVWYMREYQGFVFLLDRHRGILIFNRMGKLLKTLPGESIPYFNFLGEEVYYPEKDGLRFFDIFTAEERFQQVASDFDFALITDERFYSIDGSSLKIFSIND